MLLPTKDMNCRGKLENKVVNVANGIMLLSHREALRMVDMSSGYWYFLVRNREDAATYTKIRDFHFTGEKARQYELFLLAGFQIVRIRKSRENKQALCDVLENEGMEIEGHGKNYDAALGFADSNKVGG